MMWLLGEYLMTSMAETQSFITTSGCSVAVLSTVRWPSLPPTARWLPSCEKAVRCCRYRFEIPTWFGIFLKPDFAFNFNKTLIINNKILELTIRVCVYSEPVSLPSAPLIPLYPKSPVAAKSHLREGHRAAREAHRHAAVHGAALQRVPHRVSWNSNQFETIQNNSKQFETHLGVPHAQDGVVRGVGEEVRVGGVRGHRVQVRRGAAHQLLHTRPRGLYRIGK
jgi:hypothetical protein